MNKSPISLLQETMAKNGCVPIYTEISAMNELQQVQFTYNVKCNTTTAKGTGSNKKTAKSNAALAMLKLLAESNIIPENVLEVCSESNKSVSSTQCLSVVSSNSINSDSKPLICNSETLTLASTPSSSSSSIGFSNFVGHLMEFCVMNHLPTPVYDIINVSGPPHQYIFTMTCNVGSAQEQASGHTKKTIKQEVSKKILRTLVDTKNSWPNVKGDLGIVSNEDGKNSLDDLQLQLLECNIEEPEYIKKQTIENIVSTYKKVTQKHASPDSKVLVSEYHTVLSKFFQKITPMQLEQLKTMYKMSQSYTTNDLSKVISTICQCMENIRFSEKHKLTLIGIRLNIVPPVFEIGIGQTAEDARRHALKKICELIFLSLK